MDKVVDSIENAYDEFLSGVAELLEARKNNGGESSASADAAVESLARKYESLRVACDNADVFVNSAKQAILCKSEVDVARYERSLQDLPVDDGEREGGIILEDDETVMDEVQVKDEAEVVEVRMKESDDADADKEAVEVHKENVDVPVKENEEDGGNDKKENVDVPVKENEEDGGDDKKENIVVGEDVAAAKEIGDQL